MAVSRAPGRRVETRSYSKKINGYATDFIYSFLLRLIQMVISNIVDECKFRVPFLAILERTEYL